MVFYVYFYSLVGFQCVYISFNVYFSNMGVFLFCVCVVIYLVCNLFGQSMEGCQLDVKNIVYCVVFESGFDYVVFSVIIEDDVFYLEVDDGVFDDCEGVEVGW